MWLNMENDAKGAGSVSFRSCPNRTMNRTVRVGFHILVQKLTQLCSDRLKTKRFINFSASEVIISPAV